MSMGTKVTAIYNEGVLKLMEKVDLPEKAKVRITISVNFSKLLDEVGEIEAKEDIDKVLGNMSLYTKSLCCRNSSGSEKTC